MKLGFPTNPRRDIFEEINWIADNGFDFVDLFLEPDKSIPSNLDAERIRGCIRSRNMDVVGHTAWYIPIGSPMKDLCETSFSILTEHIDFFSNIGCDKMTVHANWPPSLFSVEEGIFFQSKILKRLTDFAMNTGVRIMYEPLTSLKDSIENVAEILKVNDKVYFHLDTGHANLHGRSPIDFIKKFKDRLIHIHLHDNNGKDDLHLPLGSGNIDWKKIIDELIPFYNDTITLEIFSHDRDYVLMSKNKLEEYIASKKQ